MIPYKSPVTFLKPNRTFNFHLSRIRIRSEHTIGYLKGRFHCLKKLRFQVLNTQDLAYVTLWINTYIILYAFCLDQELKTETDWLKDGIDWEKEQIEILKENKKQKVCQ